MGRSRRFVFFAAMATLPTLVACQAILGLDDYKRTECGSEPCPFDGSPDVVNPDVIVPDGGPDARPDAPLGVGAAVWPEFEMPNHHPEAGILSPDPRPLEYTAVDPIITDEKTLLVWRNAVVGPSPFGTELQLEGARSECQKLDPSTGPWRLPKRIELVTLLSHTAGAATPPFIDKSVFTGVPAGMVWTSSEVRPLAPGAQKYWVVDFNTGAVAQLAGAGASGAKALCVKDKK